MPPASLPRHALVLRFRPTSPERVLDRARAWHEYRYDVSRPLETYYRVSTFCDVARAGESEEDVVRRLLKAAAQSDIDISRNPKYWISTVGVIVDLGFTFHKDDTPGEPLEHYSVAFGGEPDVSVVERFVNVFEGRRTP